MTWGEVRTTLRPPPGSPDGPLPPLLLALTLVTGLVDATSYLKLGHVFVANMTGNVVFLGFGIAGAGGVSVWASLTALGSFLVGGVSGGRIGARWSSDRARHLTAAAGTELVLVAGALVVAAFSPHDVGTASRYAIIVLLAVAMGVQNAAARKLAVPDLTTTVLTMTLTGLAADSALARGSGLEARSTGTLRRSDVARRPRRRPARPEGRQPRAACSGDRTAGGDLLRRLPSVSTSAGTGGRVSGR